MFAEEKMLEVKVWLTEIMQVCGKINSTEFIMDPNDHLDRIKVEIGEPDNDQIVFKVANTGTIYNENNEDVVQVALGATQNDEKTVEAITAFRREWYYRDLKFRIRNWGEWFDEEENYEPALKELIVEKDLSEETVRDLMEFFQIAGHADTLTREVKEKALKEQKEKEEFNNYLWNVLKEHYGHEVQISIYGDVDNPADICLEDMDTNEVILDAEIYTLVARE